MALTKIPTIRLVQIVDDDGVVTTQGLSAGELHIGEVGGNCITKTVTFNRPAATTAYTVKDIVGVDVPVTGGTQATPTVITAVAHGLADGDPVTISSIVGDTAANGSNYAKVTGYNANTFALYSDKALTTPIAGNAGWSSGGDVARLFRLPGIFRKVGGNGYIMKVRAGVDSATALLADYLRIHFYNSVVAATIDNASMPILWANMSKRCGWIDLPPLSTEGTGSDMAYALAAPNGLYGISGCSNIGLHVWNGETPASTDLYFQIEAVSSVPGTPAANQPMFVEVTVDNN